MLVLGDAYRGDARLGTAKRCEPTGYYRQVACAQHLVIVLWSLVHDNIYLRRPSNTPGQAAQIIQIISGQTAHDDLIPPGTLDFRNQIQEVGVQLPVIKPTERNEYS